jgi:hypothetical protein
MRDGCFRHSNGMKRRLLNFLTALSLLLCVAAVVIFVLTGVHPFTHTFKRNRPIFNEVPEGRTRYEVRFELGGTSLQAVPDLEVQSFSIPPWYQGPGVKPRDFEADTASTSSYVVFEVTRGTGTLFYGIDLTGPVVKSGVPYYEIEVSYMALAVISLALPATRLVLRGARLVREEERRVAGLCPKCGFDLCAPPDRCRECGHQPSPVGKLSEV